MILWKIKPHSECAERWVDEIFPRALSIILYTFYIENVCSHLKRHVYLHIFHFFNKKYAIT